MKKRLLLASQRIDVDDLIRGTTLNPHGFRWAVVHSETTHGAEVTRLEYVRSNPHAFFQFDRYQRQHYALYSWGGAELEEHFSGTWSHQLLHVSRWLARLGNEARADGDHAPAQPPPPIDVATRRHARPEALL